MLKEKARCPALQQPPATPATAVVASRNRTGALPVGELSGPAVSLLRLTEMVPP